MKCRVHLSCLLITVSGMVACLKVKSLPHGGELTEPSEQGKQGLADAGDAAAEEPLDAKTLQIQRLSLSQVQKGPMQLKKASYGADAKADYVEFEACLQKEGDCVSGQELTNEFFVPVFKAGRVILRVRACVDPQHALDPQVACGDWQQKEYEQQVSFDPKEEILMGERMRTMHLLADMGVKVRASLERFKSKRSECIENNTWLKELDAYVDAYLALGERLIRLSVGGVSEAVRTAALAAPGSGPDAQSAAPAGAASSRAPAMAADSPLLVGVGATGVGVGSTLLPKDSHQVQQTIDRFNGSLLGPATKAGLETGAITTGGVPGAFALNHVLDQYFAQPQEISSCLAWSQARLEMTALRKELIYLRGRVAAIDEELGTGTQQSLRP